MRQVIAPDGTAHLDAGTPISNRQPTRPVVGRARRRDLRLELQHLDALATSRVEPEVTVTQSYGSSYAYARCSHEARQMVGRWPLVGVRAVGARSRGQRNGVRIADTATR